MLQRVRRLHAFAEHWGHGLHSLRAEILFFQKIRGIEGARGWVEFRRLTQASGKDDAGLCLKMVRVNKALSRLTQLHLHLRLTHERIDLMLRLS